MIHLNDQVCQRVAWKIANFDKQELISISASLLTLPRLSANAVRLETLVHLAVAHCRGTARVTRALLTDVLNDEMGGSAISILEDPIEDVFVSGIQTELGERRIFNSVWEANDYFVQTLIDLVDRYEVPDVLKQVRRETIALLTLSEEVALRAELPRNSWEKSTDKAAINVPPLSALKSMKNRVTFSEQELKDLCIDLVCLKRFVLPIASYSEIPGCTLGSTILERKPLIKIGSTYVVSLVSAIGVAIRMHFIEACAEHGLIDSLQSALQAQQSDQVSEEVLREVHYSAESVEPGVSASKNLPPLKSLLLRDRSNRYLHTVLIHDDLSQLLEHGMSSMIGYTDEQTEALEQFVSDVSQYCASQPGFISGITIHIHGGLGRGRAVSFRSWSDDWGFCAVSLADLLLLSRSSSKPLRQFLFCIEQENWVKNQGVKFRNINGNMNYFSFWKENAYQCVPEQTYLEPGNNVGLYTDYIFAVREELRRESDAHTALDIDGNWVRVERLTKDSFFGGMLELPIYVSLDHIRNGYLNAVIECEWADVWFGVSDFPDIIPKRTIYNWWTGFIGLIADILLASNEVLEHHLKSPMQIDLNFSLLNEISPKLLFEQSEHGISVSRVGDRIKITPERNFLLNFAQEENVGEKVLVGAVVDSIHEYVASLGLNPGYELRDAFDLVFDDPGVRIVHLYRNFDHSEYLLARTSKEVILRDEIRMVFDRIRISKLLGHSNKKFDGKKACTGALNSIVKACWEEIRTILIELEKCQLISSLADHLMTIEQDSSQWKRTAAAVQAIHRKHDDVVNVAQKRDSDRNLTAICLRSLVEIAICECNVGSGESLDDHRLDRLLSLMATLITTATDSDAIHWDLLQPSLKFSPNGTYALEGDILREVMVPYHTGLFQRDFESAVSTYSQLYKSTPLSQDRSVEDAFGPDFLTALQAEVGLPVELVLEIFSKLAEQLLKRSEPTSIVQLDELEKKILENRSVSSEQFYMFLNYFSVPLRDQWDDIPNNFEPRDTWPWKHKRRLSILVRPVIRLDQDSVLLNLQFLKQGALYFFDRANNGEFRTEFFFSQEMRSYVGSRIEARGAEFTTRVCESLRESGWAAEKEVLMPTLGAPKELGDIDVLAQKEGVLLVIECKRLQMAKTVSEVGDVLDRFRGEARDELGKHLERVEWVNENLEKVAEKMRYSSGIGSVEAYLVTNTDVPMQYRDDLPIDGSRILPYRQLAVCRT